MSPFFYSVSPVFQNGLGYGDASKPTYDEQARAVGDDLVHAVQNLLSAGHVLTVIGRMKNGEIVNDDGCGDGRAAVTVFEGNVTHRYSLNRPKVFGGGAMMSTAMLIGLGEAQGLTLAASFTKAMDRLEDAGINFGAHTDCHADAKHSGCGAIDNAQLVLQNIKHHRAHILETIQALQLDIPVEKIHMVLDNFVAYANQCATQSYNGKAVMQKIVARGKVVKKLDGSHRELFILLNNVSGMTANQSLIRDVTGGKAQLFDVDVWRLKELADGLYADSYQAQEALVSEIVYTLGVAATLTHGDLPVFMASPKEEFIPAPAY